MRENKEVQYATGIHLSLSHFQHISPVKHHWQFLNAAEVLMLFFYIYIYKRCSARQQGVPCLRLMSTQMQADSSWINNLISLHLYLLSSVYLLCVFSQDSTD